MKLSKYFNIDPNILIEFIYDDSNLIGEPYNILLNTKTGTKCFISADEERPPQRGYVQTNNDLYNQLYKIDTIQNRYGKVPLGNTPNSIDTDFISFLQIKNYARSIPVRYDTIKVHFPVNYVFEGKKGFYLKVYTYDFSNQKIIELSNFYFNITDIEQNYKLEYSSPLLILNQKQWGKYVKILIPSVTKISDQRRFNITTNNSINFNLSDGIGLSKTSPIFMDYHFIDSVDNVGGNSFFNLSPRQTVVVPQTPEFEKLGVKIEESSQGDFFLIYGVYNGTLGDFENFIDESYYEGNRYYVEYQVELYEKNVKTKTHKFIVTEDFGEEIEYRPILKFTTTTAIIDVTLRLINNVDGSFIERKASYGLLQGGGAKMGSEPNDRLNTANGTGGGGDISKYAKSLSKINLKNASRKEVINVKSTILPNVGDSPFGTRPILNLKKLPFNLFSSSYYATDNDTQLDFDNKKYIQNNGQIIYIYPFDNIISFEIINPNQFVKEAYDLSIVQNLKFTIKSDKKDLNFDIYKDSSENDLENGRVVFKISEGSYNDIKKISASGFDLFYINGVDENGLKIIVYSGFFLPWDSVVNQSKLLSDYDSSQIISIPVPIFDQTPKTDIIETVKETINQGTNLPKSVNTSTSPKPNLNLLQSTIVVKELRWKASFESIQSGFFYQNISGSSFRNKIRNSESLLKLSLIRLGFLSPEANKRDISSSGVIKSMPTTNDQKLDLLLGFFKGLNINPSPTIVTELFNKKIFKNDLNLYVESGLSNKKTPSGVGLREREVQIGEFLPSSEDFEKMKKLQNRPRTSGSGSSVRASQMFEQPRPGSTNSSQNTSNTSANNNQNINTNTNNISGNSPGMVSGSSPGMF